MLLRTSHDDVDGDGEDGGDGDGDGDVRFLTTCKRRN